MYRLAGLRPMPAGADPARLAAALLDQPAGVNRLEASDTGRGMLRVAAVFDGALEACLFLARDSASLPREAAVIPMLGGPVSDAARGRILARRMYDATAAEGPKVCACFGVARDAVRHAVVIRHLGNADRSDAAGRHQLRFLHS